MKYLCKKDLVIKNITKERVFTKGKLYKKVETEDGMVLISDHGTAHEITITWKRHFTDITKKAKKESLSGLIKELDNIFSRYIRTRFADSNGTVKCFTSGKFMGLKESQAGHFVSRRHYSTRWDEKNVQVQSVAENVFNQGNAPVFALRLDEKYGRGTAELLIQKSRNHWKPTRFELEYLINEYKEKVKKISTQPI